MSDEIKAGDVIECVDDGPHHSRRGGRRPGFLSRGDFYRAAEVFTGPFTGERVATLEGVPCYTLDGGYGLWRFRKLNDGQEDAELIARIRACKPIREEQPA